MPPLADTRRQDRYRAFTPAGAAGGALTPLYLRPGSTEVLVLSPND